MTKSGGKRTDTASRVIHASAPSIYRSLLDPAALEKWRPPKGMTGEILAFEPQPGGRFKMALRYEDTAGSPRGKSSDHGDVVEGRFVELAQDERVVELVEFESKDPAFAGAMTIVTTLEPGPDGTRVTIRCENVPDGISAEDHQAGLTSTLANLAAFTE